jgi:hypothetical protein
LHSFLCREIPKEEFDRYFGSGAYEEYTGKFSKKQNKKPLEIVNGNHRFEVMRKE